MENVKKLFFRGKICLSMMMLKETDLRVLCEDRYVALYCTGLAESGGLMCSAFVVITNLLTN